MNDIADMLLLEGDQFMHEMCLKQPEVAYSPCGTFAKNIKEHKHFEKKDKKQIYQMKKPMHTFSMI